jgi:hypothetical protein
VFVYDGGGSNCIPTDRLMDRRSGAHTSDASGDSSSYADRASLVAWSEAGGDVSAMPPPVCYTAEVNFTVAVLDYAIDAFAAASDG